MKRMKLLAMAAVVVGCMAVAPAAAADESCAGAENVAVFCAEPFGRTILETCVYTGGDTCKPVVVSGPDLTRCEVLGVPAWICWVL